MKYKIVLLLLLVFCCKANAQGSAIQEDTISKVKPIKYFYLNLDLGYCPPTFSFPVNYATDGEGFSDASPVVDIRGSVDFLHFLNTGLTITYQGATFFHNSGQYFDYLSMLNSSVHLSAHLNKNRKHFDNYIGVRFGYSYLTDQPSSSLNHTTPYIALQSPTEYVFTYQLFYGLAFYGEHVGFNLEVGLGSPFLIQGGLIVRIKENKK